jgi:hypothetical protein
LDRQREAKRKKEEMIEKKSLDKAKEDLVRLLIIGRCFTPRYVGRAKKLGRLKSESAKMEALKENIRMRVIGLGWKQFAITWSYKRAKQSVNELAAHLKMIIREEKKLTPPKDPALVMPKHLDLPILGTATRQLMESEANALINEEQFRREANELCKQREARGEGSIFSVMQPLYCPELDELINKWIKCILLCWDQEEKYYDGARAK